MQAIRDLLSPMRWGAEGKSGHGEARFDKLQVGSVIGFGALPQPQLSGKRFTVKSVSSYVFESERYIAYVLADRDRQYNLIVAEPDKEQRYLALSRRVSIDERAVLFEVEEFQRVMRRPTPQHVSCKVDAPSFKGWVASAYRPALDHVKGRLFQTDFRDKGWNEKDEVAAEFDYTLLVSESGEQALELERYDDGRVMIYATIFRPASDVEFISGVDNRRESAPKILPANDSEMSDFRHEPPVVEAFRPQLVKPLMSDAAPVLKEAAPKEVKPTVAEPVAASVKQEQVVITAKPVAPLPPVTKEVKIFVPPVVEPKPEPKAEVKVESKPAVAAAPAPVAASAPVVQAGDAPKNNTADMLECNIKVAGKIIDEAVKNEITLAELVRKVVDLPVDLTETVQFHFPLSQNDCELLGKRYGIDAKDKTAIRARVVQDLADFIGHK